MTQSQRRARKNAGKKRDTIRVGFYEVERSKAGVRAALERIRNPQLYEFGFFQSDFFKRAGSSHGNPCGYISTDRGADDEDQIKEERKMKNSQLSKKSKQLEESFSEKDLEKDGEEPSDE